MIRSALAVAIIFASLVAEAAEPVTIEASLSERQISVGEVVTLEVHATTTEQSNIEIGFTPPQGLAEVSRRQSESTSFNWSSAGQTLRRERVVVVELEANQSGKYTIGPITIRAGRSQASAQPLLLEVLETGKVAAEAPEAGNVSAPSPEERGLFVRYRASKAEAYLGEPILLDLEIYTTGNFNLDDANLPPNPDGFWREIVEQPNRLVGRKEMVGGQTYQAYRLWRIALYGLSAGEKAIEPAKLIFRTQTSIFSSGQVIRRSAPPIKLTVLPLPTDGRPSDFSSTNIGEYSLASSIDAERVPAGKAVVLHLVLSGEGNIRNAMLPKVDGIEGFRAFPPSVKDDVKTGAGGLSGSKSADIILMPTKGGQLEIPAFTLGIFRPSTKSYETLRTSPLKVVVEGDISAIKTDVAEAPDTAAPSKSVLVPIRYRSTLEAKALPISRSTAFIGLLALPPLLFGFAVASESIRSRLHRETASSRRRKISRAAHASLRAAERADPTQAYAEIDRALVAFVSEKSGVAIRGLTLDEMRASLLERGASQSLIDRLVAEMENCDFARFAPGGRDEASVREAIERASVLLSDLEPVEGEEVVRTLALTLSLVSVSLVSVSLVSVSALAADDQNQRDFTAANDRVLSGDFKGAIALYEHLVASGVKHPDVYFNLGNACAEAGDPVRAIIAYERAIILNPNDGGAKKNLAVVHKKLDRSWTEPEPVDPIDWAAPLLAPFPPSVLAWLCISANALLFGFLLLRRRFASRLLSSGIPIAGAMLIVTSAGVLGQIAISKQGLGVVVHAAALKEGPNAKFPDAGNAKPGARVRILNQDGDWFEVRTPVGSTGWLNKADFETL